jgi:hypothetical protein
MSRTLIALVAALVLVSPARAVTGMIAIGDFGVGGERQRAVGAAVRAFEERHEAQWFVTLGDNDYTRGRDFRTSWEESFGWLAGAGVQVAGALGNHDVEIDRGRYEFAALGMPRPYYTRLIGGGVQLIVLDSNAVDASQTRWLRRVLARSTARWRVVAFHHPPFTCGGHSGSAAVRSLNPLFARHRVRLVLSGHDHNYQRFAPVRGVTYVVDGGGGAPLYSLRPCPRGYPRRVAARSEHGFLYVQASRAALSVTAVGLDGRPLDRFSIRP